MKPSKKKTKADEIFLKGLALDRQGLTSKAVACYQDAIRREPGHADSLHMLGVYRAQKGELDAAIRLIQEAIRTNPAFPDYHYNLAKVFELAGRYAEADKAYRAVLALRPDHLDALINLSSLMLRNGDSQSAAQYAARALELDRGSIGALNNLALAFLHMNRLDEAEQALRRALAVAPNSADTLVNLARVYRKDERYQEAIACLRRAVAIDPNLPQALNNLGSMLKFEGRLDEALSCIRRALEIKPDASVHSNLLFNLSYHPQCPAEEIFAEHVAWARRYADPLMPRRGPPGIDARFKRRLRIGYVSADFKQHPVATFLRPIIAHHDKSRFEIFAYSDVGDADDTTRWFEGQCDVWRQIVGKTDEDVAELIRRDGIDILVDLAGHTSGNRLLVFARRPAPVQASYLGYLGTTGMSAMDYKITDAVMDPVGLTERFHAERLARLPHSMWCYAPPPDAPLPTPTPALTRGHVTFGSFNNSAKVTPDVIAAWARILRALPAAKLLMVTKGDGSVHEYFWNEFARHGIARERIELKRRMPLTDYLRLHGEVDICLDSFPYTGGTTSCHSLWMGVPVLTLPGVKPFSRSGASILSALGLTDWIAESVDAYVETAIRKASDVEALQALRAGMRERMRASSILDGKAFTQGIEALYMDMASHAHPADPGNGTGNRPDGDMAAAGPGQDSR